MENKFITVAPKSIENPKNGDFYESIVDSKIYIREDAYNLLSECNINSVYEFYSFVVNSPTSFVVGLGWTYEEVQQAELKLKNSLKGFVNDEIFDIHTKRSTPRRFGALHPKDLK